MYNVDDYEIYMNELDRLVGGYVQDQDDYEYQQNLYLEEVEGWDDVDYDWNYLWEGEDEF